MNVCDILKKRKRRTKEEGGRGMNEIKRISMTETVNRRIQGEMKKCKEDAEREKRKMS